MKIPVLITTLIVSLSLFHCDEGGSNPDPSGGSIKVKELRLSNEVSGWTEMQGSYIEFDPTNMFNLIDGGVTPYIDGGLVEGIRQVFNFSHNSETFELTVDMEDFSTQNKAQAIFNTITKDVIVDSIVVPSYDPGVALGSFNEIGGEITIFTHIDKFYFELKCNNFGNFKDVVITESVKFIKVFESKIKTK